MRLMEHRIREAVASGQFAKAQKLWNEYVVQLQEEIRRGSCPASRMQELSELVAWTRSAALCDRAHAQ